MFSSVQMLERTVSDLTLNPPFTQDSQVTPVTTTVPEPNVAVLCDPRRPSECWLRNPAWIGETFLLLIFVV